jgi:hypothetical protein
MPSLKTMTVEEAKAEIALLALQGDALPAAREWLNRTTRISRPEGQWDGGGRFYPAPNEWRDCCDGIRTPSRAYPYSLWAHVHSATHVAALYGETPAVVRRAAKLLEIVEGSAAEHL